MPATSESAVSEVFTLKAAALAGLTGVAAAGEAEGSAGVVHAGVTVVGGDRRAYWGGPRWGYGGWGHGRPYYRRIGYWGDKGCYRLRTVRTGWGRAQAWVNVYAYNGWAMAVEVWLQARSARRWRRTRPEANQTDVPQRTRLMPRVDGPIGGRVPPLRIVSHLKYGPRLFSESTACPARPSQWSPGPFDFYPGVEV